MGQTAATVEVLTAEVRVLMVGSRQVTLSVYRQLDTVPHEDCESFGRVRDGKDEAGRVWVVGRDRGTGELVRSYRVKPPNPKSWNGNRCLEGSHQRACPNSSVYTHCCDHYWYPKQFGAKWCVVGPNNRSWRYTHQDLQGRPNYEPRPDRPATDPNDRDGWYQLEGYDDAVWTCGRWSFRTNDPPPSQPAVAPVATSGAYVIRFDIPRDADVDVSVKPGEWRYSSPEWADTVGEWALQQVNTAWRVHQEYEEWMELPLIVLAGLR